jgi:hypothetical protein
MLAGVERGVSFAVANDPSLAVALLFVIPEGNLLSPLLLLVFAVIMSERRESKDLRLFVLLPTFRSHPRISVSPARAIHSNRDTNHCSQHRRAQTSVKIGPPAIAA